MTQWTPDAAVRWIAEAIETGNPLGTLPEGVAPPSLDGAEQVSAALVEALGQVPCGLRLLRPGLAGPMLETRLVAAGRPVALAALRHPRVTAAVIGVLAEPLEEGGTGAPVLARLHPAVDVSATRFGDDTNDALALTADLARLGLVVAGKGKAVAPGVARVALVAKGGRSRGVEVDLGAVFAEAAEAARRWGGLPAGALLVVAGLTDGVAPEGTLRATVSGLGGVDAAFG